MKVKNSLFTSGYTAKYKHCRNKISSLTRLSKKLYHQAFFEANLNKMKKTWEGINTLIDPNKTNSKTVSALKRSNNNTVTQNPSEVTDILNRLFSSVGQTLADNIPSSNRHLSDYFGDQVYPNSFFFDPVTPSEIESEILNKSTLLNKAYGLYSCSTRILKGANHIVSATLSEIMNMSVQTGVYPFKLKRAKVVPFYKTGDRTEPGNYRPISLLSVFNRVIRKTDA